MDWNRDDEVAGLIKRLREDQRAQVQISEEAASVERRAHAVIEICQQRIGEAADEIALLESGRA
jgi:hypothetical protein